MSSSYDEGWWWRMVADRGGADVQVLAQAGESPQGLGRRVRACWLDWARRQPPDVLAQHPHWLLPYGALSLEDQRADDEIGTALFCVGWHARGRHGDPAAPGHRRLNTILSDASRASRAGDAATVAGLRAEYDAAAAALFNLLADPVAGD